MNRLHRYLVKHAPFYAEWHKAQFHAHAHFVAVALFASLCGYVIYGHASTLPVITAQNVSPADVLVLGKNVTTAEAERILARYASAKAPARAKLENEIREIVAQRKAALVSELDSNPSSIVASALSASVVNALPLDIRANVESVVTVEGTIYVVGIEDFVNSEEGTDSAHGTSDVLGRPTMKEVQYFIAETHEDGTVGTLRRLYFTGTIPTDLVSGAKAIVTGTALDDALVVDTARLARARLTGTAAVGDAFNNLKDGGDIKLWDLPLAAAPIETREVKVLVIPMNFSNAANETWTKSSLENNFFNGDRSVKKFYNEATFGKVNITGIVTDWVTVPYVKEDYEKCTWSKWLTQSISLAQKAGVKTGDYPYTVLLINKKVSSCPTGGLATLGSRASNSGYYYLHGYNDPSVFVHELGHNIGLNHANSMDCKTAQIAPYSSCNIKEYGDPTDVMGYNWSQYYHFNAAHKANWWLEGSQMKQITQSGTYTIYPIENNDSNLKALEVRKQNTNDWYTISYRAPIGFDAKMSSGYMAGASIHVRSESSFDQTKFIDTTPGDSRLGNATLTDGGVFEDKINKIKITQISHDAGKVVIKVDLDEKAESTPPSATVTLSKTSVISGIVGTISVAVNAQDESGIAKIRVVLPPWPATECVNQPTCEATYITTSLAVGTYPVTVQVTDRMGNYKEFVQLFTVSSPTPTPATSTPSGNTTTLPTPSAPKPTTTTSIPKPATTTPKPALTCAAAAINAFTGCYYDNPDFTNLALVRNDASIAFNWKGGSPIAAMKTDTFTVRWVGKFNFDKANYTFTATVDDGMRLYIDGQLVIDQWRIQSAKTYTINKEMTAGQHEIKVEYYENNSSALIDFSWQKTLPSTPRTPSTPSTPTTTPTTTPSTPSTPSVPSTPTSTIPAVSCAAPARGAYTGCYYDDTTFSKLVRSTTDSKIDFNWGAGAPSGLDANSNSIRWTGNFDFEGGTYVFTARPDDGVRVYIDGQILMDEWRVQSARTFTKEKSLTAGLHEVRVEYYEGSGNASISFDWVKKDSIQPSISSTQTTTNTETEQTTTSTASSDNSQSNNSTTSCELAADNAFTGCYYDNEDFTKLIKVVVDPVINFNWGSTGPTDIGPNQFSVRWLGNHEFEAGSYTFTARVDDGVRLYVDGALIIDQWKIQSARTFTAQKTMTAGKHQIKVEYYEGSGQAVAEVSWAKQSNDPAAVSSSTFSEKIANLIRSLLGLE